MKRFRRWLFTGVTAMSLLLCVATAGIWVRSYRTSDKCERNTDSYHDKWRHYTSTSLTFEQGGISISILHFVSLRLTIDSGIDTFPEPTKTTVAWHFNQPPKPPSGLHDYPGYKNLYLAGIAYRHIELSDTNYVRFFRVPYWLILVGFLASSAVGFVYLRRQNDLRMGHCRNCGYDLRATPDRCPECGTVPERLGQHSN
jgi:hypothetical protein